VYHPFRHDGVSSVLLDVWGLFTGCRILKRTAENCFDKKRNTVFADVPNNGFPLSQFLTKRNTQMPVTKLSFVAMPVVF
jgi:hypothetical protein